MTTEAKKKQEVALIDANKRLAVAEQKLLAAKDLAAAIMAKGKADADVIRFANQAEAAGWQKSIAAFSGNGNEFARWTLYKKLAPAFRSMMINTDNSPLMDVFKAFDSTKPASRPPPARRITQELSKGEIGHDSYQIESAVCGHDWRRVVPCIAALRGIRLDGESRFTCPRARVCCCATKARCFSPGATSMPRPATSPRRAKSA